MKNFSTNNTKLRITVQNMYSTNHPQMDGSGIIMISIILYGCLESSLKIRFVMWLKFQKQPLKVVFEIKSAGNYQKTWQITKIWAVSPIEIFIKELIASKAAGPW